MKKIISLTDKSKFMNNLIKDNTDVYKISSSYCSLNLNYFYNEIRLLFSQIIFKNLFFNFFCDINGVNYLLPVFRRNYIKRKIFLKCGLYQEIMGIYLDIFGKRNNNPFVVVPSFMIKKHRCNISSNIILSINDEDSFTLLNNKNKSEDKITDLSFGLRDIIIKKLIANEFFKNND